MIKIALVEDNDDCAVDIISLLNKFSVEYKEKIEVERFVNGLNFIDEYKAEYDVVFMDIEMPIMNGIETAKRLRERDSDVPLVFLTVMSQYAIYGYDVGAAYFMIKPVKYDELSDRLRRILDKRNMGDKFMVFSGQNGVARVPYKKITYIESRGHWCIFNTVDGGEYRKLIAIKNVEEMLMNESFLRSSNSFIVNIMYVDGWSGTDAVVNGKTIPISRSRRKDFVNRLTELLWSD